ncbi:MAG: OadG family protein [Clostridia bacterium]|nr:OadG family protein [Clostridia bacterium]
MERLTLGLSTTVIGMLVVFFGLVILIACIYAMTSITGRKRKKPAPEIKEIPAPLPVTREAAVEEAQAEDDGAVVAAITAAIALILADEGSGSGFVVRRIRRSPQGTARARAAREEQIFSRL